MKLGSWGEQYAQQYLIKSGYIFLQSNLGSRNTEIDLVFLHPHNQEILGVEVKTSLSTGWFSESLDRLNAERFPHKDKLLRTLGKSIGLSNWKIKYDLLALLCSSSNQTQFKALKVEHLQDIYI